MSISSEAAIRPEVVGVVAPTLLTASAEAKKGRGEELELEGGLAEAADVSDVKQEGAEEAGTQPVTCLETLRNTWYLAKFFFKDPRSRRKAWGLTLAVLVLVAIGTFLTIWLSHLLAEFTNSLVHHDAEQFYSNVKLLLVLISIALPLNIVEQWVSGALALEWRRYTTDWLLARYVSPAQTYYRMKVQKCNIDNPDQRIGQDVAEFTASMVKLQVTFVSAILQIPLFSAVLLAVSSDLFFILVGGSFVATVLFLKVFGGRLMVLTRYVLRQEATFRFNLIRVREHAEPIAFYQGADFELNRCLDVFAKAMQYGYQKLAVFSIFLGSQKALYGYASLFPALILGPKILRGEVEFGIIMQANLLFAVLLGSLTTLVADLGILASVGAQAIRVRHLVQTLDDLHKGDACNGTDSCRVALREREGSDNGDAGLDDVCLEMKHVVLQPPSYTSPLLSDISLVLHSGESMLIAGESGIGKSSLLRAVGGLWTAGSGSISRCKASTCFFVPQEPYLCLGSLRDNATYPLVAKGKGNAIGDAEVEDVLRMVNLGQLVSRHGLDTEVNLESVLSGGEKQRLSFARLLLRPGLKFALLDEATSALDMQNEDAMYTLLLARVRCHASVAHHGNLQKFHTHRLQLQRHAAGGACSGDFSRISAASPKSPVGPVAI